MLGDRLKMFAHMPGQHHVVLMEDSRPRRGRSFRAGIPVPGQTQPFLMNGHLGSKTDLSSNDRDRVVKGTIIVDDQAEILVVLREDASQGGLDMPCSLIGGNGHGESRVFRQRRTFFFEIRSEADRSRNAFELASRSSSQRSLGSKLAEANATNRRIGSSSRRS